MERKLNDAEPRPLGEPPTVKFELTSGKYAAIVCECLECPLAMPSVEWFDTLEEVHKHAVRHVNWFHATDRYVVIDNREGEDNG